MTRSRWAFLAGVLAAVLMLAAAAPAILASNSRAFRAPAVTTDTVRAHVLRVLVVPKANGGRAVLVELRSAERIAVDVRVVRHEATLASSDVSRIRSGRWFIVLNLGAGVHAGPAHVLIRLVDRAHNVAGHDQAVRIPLRQG